jgi:hypothetical protein
LTEAGGVVTITASARSALLGGQVAKVHRALLGVLSAVLALAVAGCCIGDFCLPTPVDLPLSLR